MANRVNVTLPPFWADNGAGWFAHVEARFRAKQIFEEWDRFDLAVAALGKEVIQLCFAAVAHPRWRTRGRGRAIHEAEGGSPAARHSDEISEDRATARRGRPGQPPAVTAPGGNDGALPR